VSQLRRPQALKEGSGLSRNLIQSSNLKHNLRSHQYVPNLTIRWPIDYTDQCTHDSEHPPTVIDITSQPNSPTRSPPAKRMRTREAGFKSFHLNESNASPDKAAWDGALRAQKHASPQEVRILCKFFVLICGNFSTNLIFDSQQDFIYWCSGLRSQICAVL